MKITRSTKRLLFRTITVLVIFYVLLCTTLYFFQERLIFFPEKLERNFSYSFTSPFEEYWIKTIDSKRLNGLLFKTDKSKGLIFYLHGNAGSLRTWGDVAKRYTSLGYDVFLLDYRGYGKSEGQIYSEQQLFKDVQIAYDNLKHRYAENRIVVLGYSIGTGIASHLAATNHPRLLILQAPYYNLTAMMQQKYPLVPPFLLKYKFQTNQHLTFCNMPVAIFHGNQDEVIGYSASLQLKKEMKAGDTLITLAGQGHNGITDNPDYIAALKMILQEPATRQAK